MLAVVAIIAVICANMVWRLLNNIGPNEIDVATWTSRLDDLNRDEHDDECNGQVELEAICKEMMMENDDEYGPC